MNKLFRLIICFFLILFAAAFPIAANSEDDKATSVMWHEHRQNLRFQKLSTDDGLSQSSVLTIFQDHVGFMWFGTEDGLSRYDGHKFKIFKYEPDVDTSLRSNWVTTLCEDFDRNMWVGTVGGGLHSYDFEHEIFKNYRHDSQDIWSLSDDRVNVVFVSKLGDVWVGTQNGLNLLDSYNPDTGEAHFTSSLPDDTDLQSILGSYVTAIHEQQDGTLWVGTLDGGLNRIDKGFSRKNIHFTRYDPIEEKTFPARILSINSDKFGSLWVGTEDGLYRLQSEQEVFERFENNENDSSSLSFNFVRELYKDQARTIWLGTDGGGLNRLVVTSKSAQPTFIRYQHNKNDSNSISRDAIESIFEDRSGNLWVGTYFGGINKLPLRKITDTPREKQPFFGFYTIPGDRNSLNHNSVNAILEDSYGRLWIGTDGGGLDFITPADKPGQHPQFEHIRKTTVSGMGLSDDVVTTLFEDSRGVLWVGTYTGGLNSIDLETTLDGPATAFIFKQYKYQKNNGSWLSANFIRIINEDRSGYLWVGTVGGGLNRYDRETNTFKVYQNSSMPDSISNNNVLSIHEDSRDILWVGTFDGLNVLDRERGKFTQYYSDSKEPRGGLSHNFVRTIVETSSGQMWIGTNGGGATVIDFEKDSNEISSFSRYTEKQGLANNVVSSIVEDEDGDVWLGTNNGLSKYSPKTGLFEKFDTNDGLLGNEFNLNSSFKNVTGELFFGGNRGFSVIYPKKKQKNDVPPMVALTNLVIFDETVVVGAEDEPSSILRESITNTSEITLSYLDYMFTIEFAALHYATPSKNNYAYMMEGLDKKWNDIGNRNFVTFTTLPAGKYVFRVKASNGDGLWNEADASLIITIRPPFYKATWFYFLSISLIVLLLAGAYFLRVRQLNKRQEQLEKLVEERTLELELLNTELSDIALLDGMTGIANYRRLQEFLNLEWRRCIRSKSPMSIILIDVDYFKMYNDTYGHQLGDECLRKLAHVFHEKARRPGDLAARYGGEEFIVVLSNTDKNDALVIAESIKNDVESLEILHESSAVYEFVTISLGGATTVPMAEGSYEDLIKLADSHLYRAKGNGRNRVSFHS